VRRPNLCSFIIACNQRESPKLGVGSTLPYCVTPLTSGTKLPSPSIAAMTEQSYVGMGSFEGETLISLVISFQL
jgi:hypothetical protein